MIHVRLIALACALACARTAAGQDPAPADTPPTVEYEVEGRAVPPRTAASSSVLAAASRTSI